jgi:hypothetical protein
MKLFPFVPGHMSWPQYVGLAVWMALGLALSRAAAMRRTPAAIASAPDQSSRI